MHRPIRITKPNSPLDGRMGVAIRDAGRAEHGPNQGEHFFYVEVAGIEYPYLLHCGEFQWVDTTSTNVTLPPSKRQTRRARAS